MLLLYDSKIDKLNLFCAKQWQKNLERNLPNFKLSHHCTVDSWI